MCGFSGFVHHDFKTDLDVLKNMNQSLHHRGPDGGKEEVIQLEHAQIGFAHRRLSIIDLSNNGSQPMTYKHLSIVYNGEVYNFSEIKNNLIQLGHQFVSNSDTEVLLHAFYEWGITFIDKLIGMFAFVILDKKNNKVIGVRDRAGVKPFFYYQKENIFLFASELKAFHQHPHFDKKINANALACFMQFGNVPAPYSIFENCNKLQPAHYFEYDLKSKSIQLKKYWDVYDYYNQPKSALSFDEAKKETEKILSSAAEYRMVADVPVGVFLSGGYDSTCLTALLQKNRTTKLNTYTIAVPEIGLNEAPYAKDIAKYLGTNHHEMDCNSEEAIQLLDNIPYYYDEPFGDSSALPTMLVSKMARKEVTVALSADAGDEVFAGYNRYDYLMRYGKNLKKIPPILRKTMHGSMKLISADKIPYFNKTYNFPNRYEKLKNLLLNPSDYEIMMSLSKQFSDEELTNLFRIKFQFPDTNYSRKKLKDEYYSSLSYMMAIDYETYLPDDILQKVDRASMSVSLEAREPYLDHRLIEWAARLPNEYKYNKGIKKYILKEITHQYIPQQLMDRPKMGFAIPIEKWLQNEWRDKVNYYLDEQRIKQQGIFNSNITTFYLKQFINGKKEFGLKIWYLLMFQLWYEKWMN
jgi:asparagine synthase (glutamine-hydrolysing)